MASLGGRLRELVKKYGTVALTVHFSVSTVSITGFYLAINNNVDVESLLEKVGLIRDVPKDEEKQQQIPPPSSPPSPSPPPKLETIYDDAFVVEESSGDRETKTEEIEPKKRNRTAELAASGGGALALAILCNKALFPIRAPLTVALTPPIARFLARRRIINNSF